VSEHGNIQLERINNMDALQHLLTLEQIKGLKARYCRLLDTKDWDGLAALFVENAILDVAEDTGNPPIHGRAGIINQIKLAVIDAATSHQVHTPEITMTSDETAEGIWAMQDRVVWLAGKSPIPGVASITGYGQYHESYRKTDDGWKFAALRLTRFHVDMHRA
jgi:SnoaL-like domain